MEQPYLEIRTAAGRRQLVLGRDAVSIGRHSDNQIVVNDMLASRFHCVVEKTPDGYLLRDLGASNPTRINGRPVRSAILYNGDVVTVGQTELVLVLPDAPPGATPGPAPPAAARAPARAPAARPAAHGSNGGGAVDEQFMTVYDDEVAAAGGGEELETLGEDDIIDEDDDDSPIPIEHFEDAASSAPQPLQPAQQFAANYEHDLRVLAEAAPSRPFGMSDIALLTAKGQVIHDVGPTRNEAGREIVDLMRLLLLVSFRSRASDVHLEPKGDEGYQLRIRVDGVLIDAARLPADVGTRLSAMVKILCEVDPSQRNIVQEGHFVSRAPTSGHGVGGARRVDYRVSFAPSVLGQKMVMRVLDPAAAPARVPELALPPAMEKDLLRAARQDSGMVLVCGPTGSGKTTTLYALLRSLDLRQRNVVTIEDPVEIQLEGVTQLPVDDARGKSFSALLRSVLRQDPDVILVGEIRDPETAKIAMQAAITGHLVFSTVHTKDTVGTVFRLLDLGVEPYLLGQGLQVVLAQRLLRQLCPYCRTPEPVTDEMRDALGPTARDLQAAYAPRGCPRCFGTGYAGRRAVYELLQTTERFRDLIMSPAAPSPADLRQAIADPKFQPLRQTAYQLVSQGVASFEEVERVVGR